MPSMPVSTVQKYEKGVNRIAASRLWDISNALDVPVARFFAGFDARGAADPLGPLIELMATAESAELVMLFASINGSESRRRVISLVTALTNDGLE